MGAAIGTDADGAARAIIRIANNNMINALKLVSVNRGHDPREFAMVAFGGGGPLHATALARTLGISTVVVPATASVFSAWGMLTSDIRRDYFATVLADVDADLEAQVTTAIAEMSAKATAEFAASGHPEPTLAWHGRFRYQGQEHACEVDIEVDELQASSIDTLIERFSEEYEAQYTYRLDTPVELVGLHLVASADRGIELPQPEPIDGLIAVEPTSTRQVDFDEDGVHDADIYTRRDLEPGAWFNGPAVVEGEGTAIVVGPNCRATVDGYRNVIVRV